jgi:hypothetical protein
MYSLVKSTISHNERHYSLHCALEHPPLLQRESLAHILRFSLSVAVLWVEYIPHAWVLLQSFLHYSFPPFHLCRQASYFSASAVHAIQHFCSTQDTHICMHKCSTFKIYDVLTSYPIYVYYYPLICIYPFICIISQCTNAHHLHLIMDPTYICYIPT